MALGFPTEARTGGDILPILKFDAKGGDWITQDRSQNSDGTWGKDENELPTPFKFVADMAELQVGWLSFATGAPDFQMVKIGEAMIAKPSDEHKNAVRMRIAVSGEGKLREFSHSAKTVLRVLDKLHDQFIAQRQENAGLLPVIEAGTPETIKMQSANGELRFKAPTLNIVGWVERPAYFDGTVTAPSQEPAPAMAAPAAAAATSTAAPAGSDLF